MHTLEAYLQRLLKIDQGSRALQTAALSRSVNEENAPTALVANRGRVDLELLRKKLAHGRARPHHHLKVTRTAQRLPKRIARAQGSVAKHRLLHEHTLSMLYYVITAIQEVDHVVIEYGSQQHF
eukprot:scaffold3334_cov369-Prasinococcus_capsulatus_cf.AAC.8